MSDSAFRPKGYRFGRFEVELGATTLRRDGLEVRLRGRPFDILVLLLEARGEVVTRDALKQALWADDTFVDFDHGLNAAMNRLRAALGDAADNPRFIQTVPRRGYRFLAPIEPIPRPAAGPSTPAGAPPGEDAPSPPGVSADGGPGPVPPSTPPPRGRWIRPVVVALLGLVVLSLAAWGVGARWGGPPRLVPRRPMLAVLPFANLSGDTDQEYFSAGFTDELIAQLGAINPERLGVIARTTVANYRATSRSVADIGRELDVEYVLEGSVRRSGTRVRVSARLIEVASQTQLWGDTYEGELDDVLVTQRDVAMRVASSLAMRVLRVAEAQPLQSTAAYDATLRGRYLRQQGTATALARARAYFEEAIALDPRMAAAHAGLADVYHVLGAPGWELGRPSELLSMARVSAERAIALDPSAPDGYVVRGMIRLWLQWDPDAAEADLQHALTLNPSVAQAHQYLSTVHTVRGRFDEAVSEARRAASLDPLSAVAETTLAYRLYYAGRFGEAEREFQRALELAPDYASAWLGLAQARRAAGHVAEAGGALGRAAQFAGGRDYMEAHLAYAEALGGTRDRARARLRDLRTRGETRYISPYHFALVAAGLGDEAMVREELQRAFDDRSGWLLFVPYERELLPYLPALRPLLARVTPRPD